MTHVRVIDPSVARTPQHTHDLPNAVRINVLTPNTVLRLYRLRVQNGERIIQNGVIRSEMPPHIKYCLLYTSDAADE